ncbi:MAG: hypothetical protein UX99_C0004G0012 [Candidatus Amesbacteria bacterium GW2011_GWB1_47_26]|uniref:Uncharacterized protein n=1 Tax=Candidatus Amesbacteria bacterium GW2011_GWC2_45_19 TaxID=1618366 RepID=A0A0G1M4C1_9BACT|nr:MAG: hypothetical protein UX05_C0005G0024 [Candidatus Amesbacteria bacterium GW2011_GWC2_45_19]KKU38370.1 MAG: hypothetical protein UX52_C0007G0023 [Candidatus Amesbacteria bacterium GW2011_GWA1_46_35]KKU68788.1 MAG: hypothetical protein UX93_C0005G0024 [Microgenomates group bacterium GW2011_GWC1_47_20]KKU74912.1 MAG: hypothetical protein UX99_C0004G0012 [Candidatus Amesbacteria bacterium GW2011_GWB1_47_26]KKU80085.1 MAG: hypothetical protein UY06_C0006G0014 [Candidatus Amesbacteria bacteriu
MPGHATGFNQLNQRISGSYRVFVSKMLNQWFPISLHINHLIAQFYYIISDVFSIGNFGQITVIQIHRQLLPELIINASVLKNHMGAASKKCLSRTRSGNRP